MKKNTDYSTLVPPYLANLEIYQSGKPIEELAREKNLTKITKLASNENPLGPSPMAIREMTYGLWNIHQYPDQHAYNLKNKLCELYGLDRENIILGNGSEGIMAYIARSFIQPGDEVLTSEKSFIGFTILAKSAGANLIRTPITQDFKYDVKKMAEKINKNTKLIYIANPNNPTGTYLTKSEFDYIHEKIPEKTLIILDEAYFEFAKGKGDYPNSMDYRYDNVLTLRTFSKAYGLSGIRLGYGFGHRKLIEQLHKAKLPFEPNSIAQLGGFGALSDKNHLARTLRNNNKRIQETIPFLKSYGLNPINSITNFLTIDLGSEEKASKLFNDLLNEGVIIRHLKVNEMPSFVRISMGTKEEMQHFFQAFKKCYKE